MEYKEIVGFPYFVTSDGKILNYKFNKLKFSIKSTGYCQISFRSKIRNKTYLVHRLVAENFIPNPLSKSFVNHKNGIKTDNRVVNLEWVTHQENMEHAKNHGLIKRGEENNQSKLTSSEVESICKMMVFGYRNIDIAKAMNISQFLISAVRTKASWTHISCKYNIPVKSRALSCETLHWIYLKIREGLTQSQIIKLANNSKITNDVIKDLRRGHYKDITAI